ncbi:MAG: fibronectin type III domain-containing protein, partial [Elusimicrobiota bacterium]|nr:fibronectin type III domain-containing protein [Elusimicrobiota bacterium]
LATQGDEKVVVARLTLKTELRTAIWKGIKLDRRNLNKFNKPTDISKIKIYYDENKNGLFDVTGSTVDRAVDNEAPEFTVNKFPVSYLSESISATQTTIKVENIDAFFPKFTPVPYAPGRLVINDGEPNQEIVYYSGVDLINNTFTGVSRGQEFTTAVEWSTGTLVSAQAIITITGEPFGGQEITMAEKDYFVVIDIDPLATVNTQSELGIEIPTTDYFCIESPDFVANRYAKLPAYSSILNIKEYADVVTCKAQDTTLVDRLVQGSVNNPVYQFTLETDKSEAFWGGIRVFSTGTATLNGIVTDEVTMVRIWYDKDNNGFFNPNYDLEIGSAAFGNTGFPLFTDITFPEDKIQTIITKARATNLGRSQLFFITYDIHSEALPADPITGEPRTLGCYLTGESFPIVEAPKTAGISSPNTVDTTVFPYSSITRRIVASPRTVYIKSTQIFSDDREAGEGLPGTEKSYDVPRLDGDISATATELKLYSTDSGAPNPTVGFPDSGYIILGQEIIKYNAKSPNQLLSLARGQLGTTAVSHSSGTAVALQVIQGAKNFAVLKLDAWCSGFQVECSGLNIKRPTFITLNGADTDICSIKVYRDDNFSGRLERSTAEETKGQVGAFETFLGSGTFGNTGAEGWAFVPLNDPAINRGYVHIKTSTITFIVTFDIDPAAKFSHPEIANLNEVAAGTILKEDYITLIHPDPAAGLIHKVATYVPVGLQPYPPAFPIDTAIMPIVATLDTMSVEPFDPTTPTADQFKENVPVAKLTMKADRNTVIWQKIKLDLTGSVVDADIAKIKVWKVTTSTIGYDDVTTILGETCGRITYDERFVNKTVNITLKEQQIIDPAGSVFYITYDVAQFAGIDRTFGLKIGAATEYFYVQVPDEVTFPGYESALVKITEVKSTVIVKRFDAAKTLYETEGGTYQSQERVPILRLKLRTDKSEATWTAIQVARLGASDETGKPEGRNTDVKYVKIYRSADTILDPDDECISEVDTVVRGFILDGTVVDSLPDWKSPPFDIVVESTVTPKGIFPAAGQQLYVQLDSEIMVYDYAGSTAPAGKPILRIQERGKFNTPKLTHSPNTTIRKVDMFNLLDDLDKTKVITLTSPQRISPTEKIYFIAYDIGDNARAGNDVGVSVDARAWITVTLPNEVSPTIELEPEGTTAGFDKCQSSLIKIKGIKLNIRSENLAPGSAKQSAKNVPLLKLKLWTERNYITVKQLNLIQTGTVENPEKFNKGIAGGRGDLTALYIWQDAPTKTQPYGDGKFDALSDILISSVTYPFTVKLTTYVAEIPLGPDGLKVAQDIISIFVSADIGTIDADGKSTVGDEVGIKLATFGNMIIQPETAISDLSNSFPYASSKLKIIPVTAIVPKLYLYPLPKIWANPFGDGYPAVDLTKDDLPDRKFADGTVYDYHTYKNLIGNKSAFVVVSEEIAKHGAVFLDYDNDTKNDLEDLNGDGLKNEIDLDGDGLHEIDLNGDGILDIDFNYDGYRDTTVADINGDGIPEIDLGHNGTIDDYMPYRWNNSKLRLYTKWAYTEGAAEYLVGTGNGPDNVNTSGDWLSTSDIKYTMTGISLEELKSTKLLSRIKDTEEATRDKMLTIEVDGYGGINIESEGYIYVGDPKNLKATEIMHFKSAYSEERRYYLNIDERGCYGTNKLTHEAGKTIYNALYYLRLKAKTKDGVEGPAILSSIYRVDVNKPSTPENVKVVAEQLTGAKANIFSVRVDWDRSTDDFAGVRIYEIQEAVGIDPTWRTIATVSFRETSKTIERKRGTFYYYRIRAQDCAGNWSGWSTVAKVDTGLPTEIITEVINYPNPLDFTKGQEETYISYVLNQDANVTITLYDLLGYKVYEWEIPAGEIHSNTGKPWVDGKGKGGKAGVNIVIWDGKNELGEFVSKGGYIAHINVGGKATAIRKIGVIR